MMVAAATKFEAGEPAIGTTQPHIPHASLASFEGVVPKTTDWKTLGVPQNEAVAAK
jgi:phthalate 4,5-dioxygenase oxygenase subunit